VWQLGDFAISCVVVILPQTNSGRGVNSATLPLPLSETLQDQEACLPYPWRGRFGRQGCPGSPATTPSFSDVLGRKAPKFAYPQASLKVLGKKGAKVRVRRISEGYRRYVMVRQPQCPA